MSQETAPSSSPAPQAPPPPSFQVNDKGAASLDRFLVNEGLIDAPAPADSGGAPGDADIEAALAAVGEVPVSAPVGEPAPESENAAEAAPEPQAEASKKEEPRVASKLAALHKKERALWEREQALKASEGKYKDAGEFTPDELKAFRAAKQSPAKLFELMGFKSLDDVLERFSKDGGIETPMDRKARELEEKLAQLERSRAEEAEERIKIQRDYEGRQKVDKEKSDIVSFIKQNTDKYKLLQMDGSSDVVHQEMAALAKHYEETGEGGTPSYDVAAQRVEARMRQNLENLVKQPNVAAILQEILSKSPQQPGAASKPKQPIKTITSAATAGTAPKQPKRATANGEAELEEALAWLEQRERAAKRR